jgi:hypothetical protein
MTIETQKNRLSSGRLKAAGIHLFISGVIALLVASLVFFVWYPYPYSELASGRQLFILVATVDVTMGPLLTLIVYNRTKPKLERRLDLSVIGLLQIAALGYGLWTVSEARPVHLVFEYERFRVIHKVDIPPELLPQTPPGIDALPMSGPTLLSLRPLSAQESFDTSFLELGGLYAAARPDLWQPYALAKDQVIEAARPVSELRPQDDTGREQLNAAVEATHLPVEQIGYVPLATGKTTFWTILIDRQTAVVVSFLPLDSYEASEKSASDKKVEGKAP